MIWLSVFDLVRRWPGPAEQGAAIRLTWLTDSLRDAFTKLASDLSREYATSKLRAEIMIDGGFAASLGCRPDKRKAATFMKSGGFVEEF
jgi:hypothetical protein